MPTFDADIRASLAAAFGAFALVTFLVVYGVFRALKPNPLGQLIGATILVNQRPVTTAAAIITGDVIGLYSVATVPESRRSGYAEAIIRKIVEEARRSTGIERTVLQATQSGLALYQRMGYQSVTNFNVYIAD